MLASVFKGARIPEVWKRHVRRAGVKFPVKRQAAAAAAHSCPGEIPNLDVSSSSACFHDATTAASVGSSYSETASLAADRATELQQVLTERVPSWSPDQHPDPNITEAMSNLPNLWNSQTQKLLEIGLAAVAVWLLFPIAQSRIKRFLRGYDGEVTAVMALDAVNNWPGAALVDIRSTKEKLENGMPDFPSERRGKFIECSAAQTTQQNVGGQMKNIERVGADSTTLMLTSLEGLLKKDSVILMDDHDGSIVRHVARGLKQKGFRRVYIMQGGFSGTRGWLKSRLPNKGSPADKHTSHGEHQDQ